MKENTLATVVVGSISAIGILASIGTFMLEYHGKAASPALVSIAATCVGSLSSFLVPVQRPHVTPPA